MMETSRIGLYICQVIVVLCLTCTAALDPQPYSIDLESTLRTNLFSSYDVIQRPDFNVQVTVGFQLVTINYVDIKSQRLSVSGYFSLAWFDKRLVWSANTTYMTIRGLYSNEKYMWIPPVVVENSIMLSTMSYNELDVALLMEANLDRDRSQYTENGEWEILSTGNSSTTVYRNGEPYSRLQFIFKLRRRPLFHILNTLFPVVLMALLTIFVFKLPPESGERVGMSLTVLLAYAVYLTLISDLIPQTSKSVAILSTYLTIILMVSALSVVFTIVVLNVYFKTEEETDVPVWLQSFSRNVLARVTCWNLRACSRTQISPVPEKQQIMPSKNLTIGDTKDVHRKDAFSTKEEILSDESTIKYTWKEIALMLDRCFLVRFIALIIVTSVVCLSLLVSAHNNN